MNSEPDSVTTPLRDLWDDMVERRLWPVALALVVRARRHPVILSKPARSSAAPLSPAPAATGSASAAVAFQPVGHRRGQEVERDSQEPPPLQAKDPFTPQGVSAGGGGGRGSRDGDSGRRIRARGEHDRR